MKLVWCGTFLICNWCGFGAVRVWFVNGFGMVWVWLRLKYAAVWFAYVCGLVAVCLWCGFGMVTVSVDLVRCWYGGV
jgi:hypothetical protein